jgi:hypothetical protein
VHHSTGLAFPIQGLFGFLSSRKSYVLDQPQKSFEALA